MSRLFVCVGKKANYPYELASGRLRIYTIEELCYYICENAGMLDEDFMCEELAVFVEQELGLEALATELYQFLHFGGSLHAFCGRILEYAFYVDKKELHQIEQTIRECEQLPVTLRMKKQADCFMEEKEYYKAQKTYRAILMQEAASGDQSLEAEIYERLGCIAAMMFHYESAAYCYKYSYDILKDESVLKKYLLCRRLVLSHHEYMEWIAQNEEFYELAVEVERDYELAKTEVEKQMEQQEQAGNTEELKKEFYRMVTE